EDVDRAWCVFLSFRRWGRRSRARAQRVQPRRRSRTANAPRPAGADHSMGYLPGSVPAGAARSGGRIVRRSVLHTPRHWETGRPRAAQFAPWAVYILGRRDDGVYTGAEGRRGAGRKVRRMVTDDLLSRARAGDGEAFRELAESHRRELQVHCYRMLGSLQDAEDAVQETMLAAWQGIGGFTEERASLRTWLYKIAT